MFGDGYFVKFDWHFFLKSIVCLVLESVVVRNFNWKHVFLFNFESRSLKTSTVRELLRREEP